MLTIFFIGRLKFSRRRTFIAFNTFTTLICNLVSVNNCINSRLLKAGHAVILKTLILTVNCFVANVSLLGPSLVFVTLKAVTINGNLFGTGPTDLLSGYCPPGSPQLSNTFALFCVSVGVNSLVTLSLTPIVTSEFNCSIACGLYKTKLVVTLLICVTYHKVIGSVNSRPSFQPVDFDGLLCILLNDIIVVFIYT